MPDPRRIDCVTPGLYRTRRVRQGPWIAAEITVTEDTISVSEDGGPPHYTVATDTYEEIVIESTMTGQAFSHPLLRVAWFGVQIDLTEYRHLIAVAKWAREHAPDHPAASPDKPISLANVRISRIF